MAGTKDGRCRRIGRQGALLEIDKNEGGGCNNEEKKKKNGRKNEGRRGKKEGNGGKETCSQLFTFSSRLVDRNDVVSFINRLDSTTDERKTCSYAICHGDGILLKLTKR